MKRQKKVYKTPQINRVKLVVKSAVLADCHDSPSMTAADTLGCLTTACFDRSG